MGSLLLVNEAGKNFRRDVIIVKTKSRDNFWMVKKKYYYCLFLSLFFLREISVFSRTLFRLLHDDIKHLSRTSQLTVTTITRVKVAV